MASLFDSEDPFAAPPGLSAPIKRAPLKRTVSSSSTASLPTPPTSSDNEHSDSENDEAGSNLKAPRTPTHQMIPLYGQQQQKGQRARTNRPKSVDRIDFVAVNGQKTPSPKGLPRYFNQMGIEARGAAQVVDDEEEDDPFAAPKATDRTYKGKGFESSKGVKMTSYVFRGKKVQIDRATLSDSEDESTKAVPCFLFPEARKPAPVSPVAQLATTIKPATPAKAKMGDLIPPTPQSNVRRKRKATSGDVKVYKDETAEERERKKQRLRAEMGLARRVGGSAEQLSRQGSAGRVLFQ